LPPAADRPAPGRDCGLCPRLVAYRLELRTAHPDWHNAPVPSFGDPAARLLVVGLAPGAGGANRTGRPFTGDFAGDLLYAGLARHGLSQGRFAARPDDGLQLAGSRITNAVRCVPPENRPTLAEIATCRQFLAGELAALPAPAVVLALGRIAWESVLRALGRKPSRHPFAHGAVLDDGSGPILVGTYHTSRYNVNTGRLTEAMFAEVMDRAAALLRRRDS
jgi:uracil-DNA glycosylase family 4